jgi:hypothetical protein
MKRTELLLEARMRHVSVTFYNIDAARISPKARDIKLLTKNRKKEL